MATTRRKGSALSKTAVSKALKEEAADYNLAGMSSDQESGNYTDDNGDDGDFDVRKSSVKPSAKRQKTATNAKAGKARTGDAAKSARRRKDLSLLPTMPLDILYEIFGQLSPKDLISLSRTNKMFRKTLLASNATTVWKAAREECNAPEPPRDYNEPRWAALLFLTSCWSCGAKGVPKVDWYLRRRVCVRCKQNHLVYSGKFKSRFPDYESEVLSYVTFTHTGGWSHGHRSNSKFYWDDDIHPIVEQWRKLQHAAHLGQLGARDLFKNWKDQRTEHLEYVAKMAQTYETWSRNVSWNKFSDAADNREKRLEAVKAKFLELGYDAVDINRSLSVYSDGISTGTSDVTNAVWSRLRPKLEPGIEAERNRRVACELESTMNERMSILKDLYDVYLSSLKPSDCCFCPPAQFLRPLPEVVSLIEAGKDVVVTSHDFQPILDNIATHIANYQEERRQFAISTLPETETQPADPLSLAKNVFMCEATHTHSWDGGLSKAAMSGWPMIGSHFCIKRSALDYHPGIRLDRPCKVIYNNKLSGIASNVITVIGLDPSTASCADMDQKDARFTCDFCSSANFSNIFTWRGALFHGHTMAHNTPNLTFSIAPDTLAAEAKAASASIQLSAHAWSCNHCHSYVGKADAQTQCLIFEHLKTQ
ncbi:hypothetical protein EST38_g7059 [Candolleomyces aberdarensis]|uniref:F-box domain-containing protein n=1 Tax=Candolleomyces aberdarensis TaxID=2316362 RepID=A0A4Q2DI95_9AGAR|nr:hypothetical protein EST38_g7059 [Candolleomyces aberdarensis]